MAAIRIKVNFAQVISLGEDLQKAKRAGLKDVLDFGVKAVNRNAPEGKSDYLGPRRKLNQGAASEIFEINTDLYGEISVTAVSPQGPTAGLVTLKGGRTKTVKLRATGGYDYAQDTSQGTGIFGPIGTPIIPREARVLIIPVEIVPTLNGRREVYIDAGGQKYILRKNTRGQKPNDYIGKSAEEIEANAQSVFDAALDRFM
jgi:hypothetical protein